MYVKLIEGKPVEAPINKGNIINYNLNEELLRADGYKLLIEVPLPPETEIRKYGIAYHEKEDTIEEEIVFLETIEEAEERLEREERQRIDSLTLTPSDVERALYYSDLEMDFDDLKALIAERAPQIDLKGLGIEFRANLFYRGAVDKKGRRIVDMIGDLLGYTSLDMDYLFEHKELPHKNLTTEE